MALSREITPISSWMFLPTHSSQCKHKVIIKPTDKWPDESNPSSIRTAICEYLLHHYQKTCMLEILFWRYRWWCNLKALSWFLVALHSAHFKPRSSPIPFPVFHIPCNLSPVPMCGDASKFEMGFEKIYDQTRYL